MSSKIHPKLYVARINYFLGVTHFLHSASAILLLLMVGQAVGQSDSTKAKLLKIILPVGFGGEQFWFWVVGLILVKFSATFFKNYLYPINVFRVQKILREQWFEQQYNVDKLSIAGSDFKSYAKAFIKGVIYLSADLLMLGFIFVLLFNMNLLVSFCWLGFILFGLLVRFLTERIAPNSRGETNKVVNVMMRKWKKWLRDAFEPNDKPQSEMDRIAYKDAEIKAESEVRAWSLKNAWTAGFFPVYYFLFLFLLARIFGDNPMNHGNILQLLLLIIYSQSAIMRLFKTPMYWREMRVIQSNFQAL